MISFDDIKLTRLQLKEVLGCLPNNFLIKERKIFEQGLSEIEKETFDQVGFIDEKLANLYKFYPEIIVTIQDKILSLTNLAFTMQPKNYFPLKNRKDINQCLTNVLSVLPIVHSITQLLLPDRF
jgi:hypothetical protein